MSPSVDFSTEELVVQISTLAQRLEDHYSLNPLLEMIGNARYVLLGEASHGTSEYYTWRARITQRLIKEKHFDFVAVEGDWPDCYALNRYVKDYPDAGAGAPAVLRQFQRWPAWMWANWEVAAFLEWLRRYNQDTGRRVGFYGLDMYSLWESMEAILDYLQQRGDGEAVEAARRAFMCFEPYNEDPQTYGWNAAFVPDNCRDEVVDLLRQMRRQAPHFDHDPEAAFSAEQNARVAVEAERYYRAMMRGGPGSWNLRDRHMADTLERLMELHGPQSRGIVWAHNTHVGDARYTDMAGEGMVNVGQLVREQNWEGGVAVVGFGSYYGEVIAGRAWGGAVERMSVPPARPGSWEDIMHRSLLRDKLLILRDVRGVEEMREERGHRAIGVVYRPEAERYGNYVPTLLPERYDAFLFMDETSALHPLHGSGDAAREPDLYPWGL
ncbi:MAG: erythromycin esterase family protein [Candidatus Zixiibacteriota bacterium]|nr:MAG: erythromycin esterase family protein [candidate division Zixibacteria bacterium]